MNIYQNSRISRPEDADLPAGTVGIPFAIESTEMFHGCYRDGSKDVLSMALRERGENQAGFTRYGLIGKEVFDPFLKEIGVDSIEELVSKDVLVFIPPQCVCISGLAVRH